MKTAGRIPGTRDAHPGRSRPGRPAARDRLGFTLVELLVVIAIISVLAALLLPALEEALESARRAQCMHNVKQLSVSVFLGADDHDGALVTTALAADQHLQNAPVGSGYAGRDDFNGSTWTKFGLQRLLDMDYMPMNLMRCPAMDYHLDKYTYRGRTLRLSYMYTANVYTPDRQSNQWYDLRFGFAPHPPRMEDYEPVQAMTADNAGGCLSSVTLIPFTTTTVTHEDEEKDGVYYDQNATQWMSAQTRKWAHGKGGNVGTFDGAVVWLRNRIVTGGENPNWSWPSTNSRGAWGRRWGNKFGLDEFLQDE